MDISGDVSRQVVISAGTSELYNGHPTTLLMPDGRTIFCAWTRNHGGPCEFMKRSDDGGRTWSPLLDLPADWASARNCPVLFRLPDPSGRHRLFVFAGQGSDGFMHNAWSEDTGRTWSPMHSLGLFCVMPFCTILPIENGHRLLGITNIRRPGETPGEKTNVLAQSYSEDGGFTWSPFRVVLDDPGRKYCEPWLVPSLDGSEWTCLIRENLHRLSWHITTRDEGRTWSPASPLPISLAGDRHIARHAPDGRLVVVFRDRAVNSGTTTHFVAWVGRYEDMAARRPGQYRIKLLHSHAGGDCGYPGLECLADGTFVATTYIKYREGSDKNSIVSTCFRLDETDAMAATILPRRLIP